MPSEFLGVNLPSRIRKDLCRSSKLPFSGALCANRTMQGTTGGRVATGAPCRLATLPELLDVSEDATENLRPDQFAAGRLSGVNLVDDDDARDEPVNHVCRDLAPGATDEYVGARVAEELCFAEGAVQIWRRQRSCRLEPPRNRDSWVVIRTRALALRLLTSCSSTTGWTLIVATYSSWTTLNPVMAC